MFFDALERLLAKYKHNLGPLYQPAFYLLGALVFLTLIGAIIAGPILFLGSPLLAVVLQVFLLAIYFFLLHAVRFNVVDRFAFFLCFLVVVLSAATTIDADNQFRELLRNSSVLEEVAFPHLALATYGLLRGAAFFAWGGPLLLAYLTFAPAAGDAKSQSLMKYSLWSGFWLQALAVTLVLFHEGTFSTISAALYQTPEWFQTSIVRYRIFYAVFYLGSFIVGFLALAVIALLKRRTNTSILITVAAASLIISLFFSLSQVYVDELNARYPAATRDENIEVYMVDFDNDRAIYIHSFLRRLGSELSQFESVFVCRAPDSGLFRYEAWDIKMLEELQRYPIERIRTERPELLFCITD